MYVIQLDPTESCTAAESFVRTMLSRNIGTRLFVPGGCTLRLSHRVQECVGLLFFSLVVTHNLQTEHSLHGL